MTDVVNRGNDTTIYHDRVTARGVLKNVQAHTIKHDRVTARGGADD